MKYKALIFDLDGTLYHQFPVRLCMALKLLCHYLLRPHRLNELLLLKTYRNLRENKFYSNDRDFEAEQLREAAILCNLTTDKADRIITLWMIHEPLKLIKIFRRRKLLEFIAELQNNDKIIVVYSDYPVKDKLRAMNFSPDYAYYSGDKLIQCMKPNSEGLSRIISVLGIEPENILYVGDRDDRDGLCAKGAGIDYMDVKDFCRKIYSA